jgi:hypothetical protein
MSQAPSIIKLIQPVKEINGGGNISQFTDLNGEDTPAINYIDDFQKCITSNIVQVFKNPNVIGGGNIYSGTPFGIFEENVISQGGVLENNNQIYNFIIQLQLI